MRANKQVHERYTLLTQAQSEVWDVLLRLKLSDLEVAHVLSQMQSSLVSRMAATDINNRYGPHIVVNIEGRNPNG